MMVEVISPSAVAQMEVAQNGKAVGGNIKDGKIAA
jgi:hypothetical protein